MTDLGVRVARWVWWWVDGGCGCDGRVEGREVVGVGVGDFEDTADGCRVRLELRWAVVWVLSLHLYGCSGNVRLNIASRAAEKGFRIERRRGG